MPIVHAEQLVKFKVICRYLFLAISKRRRSIPTYLIGICYFLCMITQYFSIHLLIDEDIDVLMDLRYIALILLLL